MQDLLESIFSNINDWLKFAETKSATLLAANGLVVFGALRLAQSIELTCFSKLCLSVIVLLFSISLLLCLTSFIPALTLPFIHKKYEKNKDDNLLYFAHIENYTPNAYLTELAKSKGNSNKSFNELEKMYAKQIITNSVIASYKYSVFKKAIILSLVGGFFAVATVIVYIAGK